MCPDRPLTLDHTRLVTQVDPTANKCFRVCRGFVRELLLARDCGGGAWIGGDDHGMRGASCGDARLMNRLDC